MPSDPKKFIRFTVLLTRNEHANLMANANARECSQGELVRRAIEAYLSDDGGVQRVCQKPRRAI